MNIIKGKENPELKSLLEIVKASRFEEDKLSSPKYFLNEICDEVLHHEKSKDCKDRDKPFISFLESLTLPQLSLDQMKDEYKEEAKDIIKERRRCKKSIQVWNPSTLLPNASSKQIYESAMVVEDLNALSCADPDQCTLLLKWMKDEVNKFDSAKMSKIDQFNWCLYHMKNIVQIMRQVSELLHLTILKLL